MTRRAMEQGLPALLRRIGDELADLRSLRAEIGTILDRIADDDAHASILCRAAGSILHDFYNGIERIFVLISKHIDGIAQNGGNWHIALLESMTRATETRPVVLREGLAERLKEYLGFRHVFRHRYGFEIQLPRAEELIRELRDELLDWVDSAIVDFVRQMDGRADERPEV